MRVQERQRVNSEGLFSLAASGKDGAQRRGEGKIMEIFGPLCTASLPLPPSVITELKFLTCTDKITFLGSFDKMMSHNSPLPTEKRQKKIELILWDCSFFLLASRDLACLSPLFTWRIMWISSPDQTGVVGGLPSSAVYGRPVTAACGTLYGGMHCLGLRWGISSSFLWDHYACWGNTRTPQIMECRVRGSGPAQRFCVLIAVSTRLTGVGKKTSEGSRGSHNPENKTTPDSNNLSPHHTVNEKCIYGLF